MRKIKKKFSIEWESLFSLMHRIERKIFIFKVRNNDELQLFELIFEFIKINCTVGSSNWFDFRFCQNHWKNWKNHGLNVETHCLFDCHWNSNCINCYHSKMAVRYSLQFQMKFLWFEIVEIRIRNNENSFNFDAHMCRTVCVYV